MQSSVSKTVDQAVGTTYDAHVLAGYKFLMQYYDTRDKIYLFGFSRGAYTAKFLARMVHTVGLLCKGNAEMAPFAFRLYQRYLAGQNKDIRKSLDLEDAEDISRGSEDDEMELPTGSLHEDGDTHANDESSYNGKVKNIKVYFLGMWDCVNSVAVLERNAPIPMLVKGTAQIVRHAVSVDERRVKFKPALPSQDIRAPGGHEYEDIKVWFPGSHGDVGGGWPAREDDPPVANDLGKITWWGRMKNFWTSAKPNGPSEDARKDPFQMSDLALAWMISEAKLVGQQNPAVAVKWSDNNVGRFEQRFKKHTEQAMGSLMHDLLKEWFSFITRWELEKNIWVKTRFPLNRGGPRDIARDDVLHESILWRMRNDPTYMPKNNHGGKQPPCLKSQDGIVKTRPVAGEKGSDHQTYRFTNAV